MYKSLRLLLILLLGCNMAKAQTTVFPYTGAPDSYTVPAGVTSVLVNVQGAPGGFNSDNITYDNRPGYGGCVSATILVTPGQVLTVRVGGHGGNGTTTTAGVGGYNGGGNSTHALGTYAGGAGGGASDIYFGGTPLVVGGGGGGAGMGCGTNDDRGGDGGGTGATPAEGEDGAGCGTITGGGGGDLTGNGMGGFCGTCVGPAGVAGAGTVGGDGGWGGGGGGGGYFGAGGGHWSGGGGGASYFGGPDVYMISETRGCRVGVDGFVSITPSCIPGTISGDNRVCIGSSIALTTTTVGGTWSSSNIAIASVIGSGLVTGVGAGVADITYTIVPGIPGCRVVRSVTVDPLPLPISGAPFVCEEATVTLTTLSTGGFWSSSDVSVATVGSATGDVTGVLAGPVVISYTDPTTGCSNTWPLTVQPMPMPITGTPEVCVLGSTTLASGTPGGDWTSGTGSGSVTVGISSGVVDGVAAGVVPVSYTLPAYPLCARTIEVTVNPLPSVITSSSASMIACMGRTLTLNATPSGGTWSYTAGTGTGTIDAGTGEFIPATTGTVTVAYTLPTGCMRAGVVTINPAPAAIGGPTAVVCEGSTISFTSATTGTWTSSATGTATASLGPGTSSSITGIDDGVATITYTSTATTCFATRDVTVNITPEPITGPSAVCTGTITTYTTTPTGGTWTVSAGPGSISTTGDYTASAVGGATIRYTLPGTGCFRAIAVAVNPTPNPITGPTQVCVAATITHTTTTTGGTWSSPEEGTLVTVVGTGASATITGVAAGVATISYTMPTGCFQIAYVTVNPNPSAIVATVTALCAGDCTTLTNPDGGGTWSSSLSASGSIDASTGVLCGVFGGAPVISYSFPSGCYATIPISIIGLPSPFVPTLSVCMGATTTILSGGGTGVWSSSATAVATISSISGDVTPVSPGVTTLCYTFEPSGGSCFRCESFTVNPAPSAISGPNTVCEGATITYTATPPGGTWTAVGTNATVGAGTGIVTGVTPGTETIRYTIGSGCAVEKTVTVNPSPTPITGVMSICVGQNTVLSSSGITGFGDFWTTTPGTGSVTFSGSTTTTSVTAVGATGPGTATVTYTVAGCSRSAVITINVLATPITGPGRVCQGSAITLANATGPGTWSSGSTGVATVNSTSGLVTGVTPGTSVITYVFGGCGSTVTVTVDPIPTSIVTPLGSTTLCPGDFVALTSTTGAGYSYQWRLGAANVPGATNATHAVSSATAGNYSVVIRLNSICPIPSNTVTVTNNAVAATISPAGVVSACASTPPVLTGGPSVGFGGPFTFQWLLSGSPIAGVVTNTFTPTASGTYSVRVTNAAGCTGTSVVANVTLGASPLADVTIVRDTTFCSGDSVHLSTAPGPGYTYQWRIGGLPVAGATNPNYTATMAGLHSVRVTNTTGCSTISRDVLVTVTAPPPASIIPSGGTLLCAGGAVILDGPAGPYTYEWLKGGVIIPGATNALYTATTTGSYVIRVTSPLSGCSATSAVQTVNVVPAAIVSPLAATSFCWGGSVSLFASVISSAGPVEYRWKSGSAYIPGATNATYVASTSGTYSVELTVAPGTPLACPITSLTTTVTEWPLPNPMVTFDGITLHTGVSFVSYQWYKNMIGIAGPDAYTPHCRNRGLGSYTVRVTDLNGCQSVSPAFVVTYFTPRPGEPGNTIPDGSIRIFPNPATNTLHIEAAELMHVVITSMDGRTVIDQQNAQDIDLGSITDGIYLVKLYNSANELVKTEKLVKQGN